MLRTCGFAQLSDLSRIEQDLSFFRRTDDAEYMSWRFHQPGLGPFHYMVARGGAFEGGAAVQVKRRFGLNVGVVNPSALLALRVNMPSRAAANLQRAGFRLLGRGQPKGGIIAFWGADAEVRSLRSEAELLLDRADADW